MSVQARFWIQKITEHAGPSTHREVVLVPVTRGKHNADWAAATPSGNITMQVNNPDAGTWFAERLGKELAITFDDRPESCTVCGEEVTANNPAGYYAGEDNAATHVRCKALA